MAGNFLANAGLVAQGMDEANAAQQRLQTGQIGLDELQRTTDQAKQYRAAVSGSDPSAGRMGAYHSISKAALGAGDIDTYNKAQEASKKLQDEGFGQLAMGALTGKPPAEIESQFNGLGIMKIQPGSLEWGKDPATGDIVARGVSQADSKPYVFNATQYAKLHGLIKGAEFDLKDGVIFNKNTGETKTADTRGDWVLGSIANGNTEVPLIYNKRDGSVQQLGPGGVRTNIDAKIHATPDGKVIVTQAGGGVAEFKPSTEGTPGKTNFFGADTPGAPAQPARVVAAQSDAPPIAGAQWGIDPTTKQGGWFVKSGNGYARVNVAGQAAPTAAPAAVAAPAPAANRRQLQPSPLRQRHLRQRKLQNRQTRLTRAKPTFPSKSMTCRSNKVSPTTNMKRAAFVAMTQRQSWTRFQPN
jgi:hypothetical protein